MNETDIILSKRKGTLSYNFTVRTVHPLLFTPNVEKVRPVHIDPVAVVALEVRHAKVAAFLKFFTFTPPALQTGYFAGVKIPVTYPSVQNDCTG